MRALSRFKPIRWAKGALRSASVFVLCTANLSMIAPVTVLAMSIGPEVPIATNRQARVERQVSESEREPLWPGPFVDATAAIDLADVTPKSLGSAQMKAVAVSTTAQLPKVLTALDLPLVLNGRFLGMISADLDLAGDGLIDGVRLLSLLKTVFGPEAYAQVEEMVASRERVPLSELQGQAFRLSFISASLELRIEASPDAMAPTELHVSGFIPEPKPASFTQPEKFSAGLNVGLAQRYTHDGNGTRPLQGAFDGLVHLGGFKGVTLIAGADFNEGARGSAWSRREARLVYDDFESGTRLNVGEFTPSIDGFQGSGRMVGIGLSRAYAAIRPFQNVRPSGRQSFTLDREATVDVVINGLTTQSLRLVPGRYSLTDFPFATGANQVQLLVNDNTGQKEIALFNAFSGAELLGKNVIDFGLAAGRQEGSRGLHYDGPYQTTGFVRKGMTDALTLGLNGQATRHVQQLGGLAVWGSPIGLMLMELSASYNHPAGKSGTAGSFSYRRNLSLKKRDDLRFTATVQSTSANFESPFQKRAPSPEQWRASGLVQWNTPWLFGFNLGLDVARGRARSPDRRQLDAGVSRSFGRANLVANFSVTHTENARTEKRFSVGLAIPLGQRWTSQARYDSDRHRSELSASRYSYGGLNEVSAELRMTKDDQAKDLSGRLNYTHNRFEADFVHNQRYDLLPGGRTNAESALTVNSFIGYVGGEVAVGRPTRDGFIIAPIHKSLAGSKVEIRAGTQTIARSGWLGSPLVPIRRAYGVNSYDINVDPLPSGYDIGSGRLSVFPGFGTAYKLMIGSDASRMAVGTLLGPNGPMALATGTIEPLAKTSAEGQPLFTNRAGRFVAERLSPGRYRIVINGTEVGQFDISDKSEGLVDVGIITIKPH
ncbi:MAG: hypothetical protein RJA87_2360 [Pseudomonadota bacterium]